MNPLLTVLLNLSLTVAIELLVIRLFSKELKALKMCIACNLITNPLINVILILLANFTNIDIWCYYICVFILECLVVISEAFLYQQNLKWDQKRALLVSLTCNIASFGLGLLLQVIIK